MAIEEEKIVDQMKEFTKGIKAMQKEFGAGSLFVLGEDTRTKAEFIPIDSMKLSRIMGGGIPRGTFIEIFGWESSGKTTISSYLVGQAQKAGYVCAYIDSENAFNSDYAKVVGLNPDNLIFSQPDNAEQGLSIVESLVDNIPNLGIIVIDSIATLTPQKEIDGDMGDANMGLQARLLGQAFRKLVRKVKDKKVTVLMTNQVRHKIGVMYGSPDTTPGGNAPKFYSSIRLRIRKAEDIIEKNDLIGIKIHIKAIKNKVATPMREDVMELYFDTGFDVLAETIDFAVHYGLIKKGGAWFTIDTGEIFQGKSKVVEYYKNNVDDLIKLRDEVLTRMNENRREINGNTDTIDKQNIY